MEKSVAKPRAGDDDQTRKQDASIVVGAESAPLIFANGILSYGVRSGVAHFTLVTRRDIPTTKGNSLSPRLHVMCDLRIPVADLAGFRQAIEKALLLRAR